MAAPDRGTDAAVGARDDAPPSPPKFHHHQHYYNHHPTRNHSNNNHHRQHSHHHDQAHHVAVADHGRESRSSPPAAYDSDHTPRSGPQPAEDTQPAWQSLPATHHTSDLPYHSPRPLRYHTAYLPTSHSASADPSPSQTHSSSSSLNNMAGHRESSDAPDPQRVQQRTPERPAFRRDQLSSASTASNCTVRAPPVSDLALPTAARSNQRPHGDSYPRYPNQSYSVLQSQEEFMRYPNPPLQAHQIHPPGPHLLRTRSSHPSQYSSFSSVSTGLHPAQYIPIEGIKTHDHGIRTAGNSPATSPGLFDMGQPIRPVLGPSEEHGYYSSPYLHFTQRQVPKETHVADVDVDPISGRKIINQYEIIDELGRGVHGKVKLGRSLETGQFVAIKIVDRYSKRRRLGKNTSHEDKIRKEIAILKKARHPNIVGLLEVIDDPSRKKVYIVLEHVELGEVRWRTEGSREIIQIEHRRYEREARGIFDNESAALEDQRILLEAQRKRERQEKRRLRRLHAKREHEAGAESWSFEHGGDTEEEDSEGEEISRTSTATNEDPMGLGKKRSRAASSRAASPTDMDAETTPHAPLNERVEELRESMPSSSSLPSMGCEHTQEEPRSQSVTGLEGTMYGAYVSMPFRGRNPSIAGSSSSNNLDQLEDLDVPEHFRYVPLMTLSATRNAFRDTVLGLEYLHYQGVVHRDIKPANLLQSRDNRIKISDFGVSYLGRRTAAAIGDDQSESDAQDVDEAIELAKTVGTPAFYAPELCQTDADADALPVTGQIDVWALGVTLYCLVFGRVPFHDLNTFVVMRLIAEDEVYIPRFRLRAVDDRSGSRPGSHSRFFNPMTSNKRGPHDLVYEEIDDDLYDLLKRLFIKDPRRRITLREVKHHPWVLRDIADPIAWLEETDPSRETQGKKIEVSPNDVENAVVQLNLLERVKSGMRKLGGALGIGSGSKSSKSSRERPKGEGGVSSAASSSSTISQDARRSSLRPDDTIFAALRASRESDHPLSQSVTVSPDVRERAEFFIGPTSRPDSPDDGVDDDVRETTEKHDQLSFAERASQSSMSTAGSVRTLRQADFDFVSRRRGASPTMPQGVPSTPLTLDTPGASNLSGIFGGAGRRILRSVRSKERSSTERKTPAHSRATSIDRLVAGEEVDPHGEPSIALSDAVASGHVDPPAIPTESSAASSVVTSPASPVSHSTDARPLSRDGTPSRQSSISSTSSHRPRKRMVEEDRLYSLPAMQEYLDERFNRARDENRRRRIAEEQAASRPTSSHGPRPPSNHGPVLCPPSPDDEFYYQKKKEEESYSRRPSMTPRGYPVPLTSSSSDDQFFSGVSQSTSNPSLPSVISANSSIIQDEVVPEEQEKELQGTTKLEGPVVSVTEEHDHDGYDGDHALESDEDDDSSDDDFIELSTKKRKPPVHRHSRSESVSNAEISRHQVHSSISTSISTVVRKSSRSGSNGTVKKVRSNSGSDMEIIHHESA